MEYDVVVVGAGPAGSMTAKYAAQKGVNVLIIEEHATIGQPVQCSGIISTRAYEECEVPSSLAKHAIRGAYVHAPDGRVLPIDGRRTMAYVIDRRELDRAMAIEALHAGAAALVKTRYRGFRWEDNRLVVNAINHGEPLEIRTRVLVGADGVQSTVGRDAGLGRVKTVLTCAQAEVTADPERPACVHLYLGCDVAPGFFAWVIPTHAHTLRIGLCSTERSFDRLQHLMRRLSERYATSLLEFAVGGIPLGPPPSTVADGIMIVGDAAGQVKPTSGGGIYPGIRCAKIAGTIAAEAVLRDNVSAAALMSYDTKWRADVGRDLVSGWRIRQTLNALSDSDVNDLVAALDDERMLDIITQYGDMDRPSVVLRKLLLSTKAPRLFKLLRPMLKAGLTRR
ncbi:MAG: geranylgeranyl reductase family protein [Halobacteriota archaeon]